jgi:ABC-type polysaccharide/polyol phosphate transport system ATPase subunit
MYDDVLVRVDNVSKRFCRSLKRSLWYGLQDLGSELGGRRHGGGGELPQSSADVGLRKDEFWAVKDVSFELRRGECLGLIGRNGAGKTTLLRMLNGLIKPDTGSIKMRGQVGALIALGAGFNPVLTGRENIYVASAVMGLTKQDVDTRIDEIIDFAGIFEFIDSPVQSYSSGMSVRLGFAVASSMHTDVLIVDEVLAVGDIEFKIRCYNRLAEIRKSTATILVSHSMHDIGRTSTKCALMQKGNIVLQGNPSRCISLYNSVQANILISEFEKNEISTPIKSGKIVDSSIHNLEKNTSDYGSLSCSFNLELYSKSDVPKARVRLLVDDISGEKIYEWTNTDHSAFANIKRGLNIINVKINNIYFASGSYLVRLILEDDSSGEYLINYEPAFPFAIECGATYGARCRGRPNDVLISSK